MWTSYVSKLDHVRYLFKGHFHLLQLLAFLAPATVLPMAYREFDPDPRLWSLTNHMVEICQ